MPDGKVIYEVRADDSKLDQDLDNAQGKVKKSSGGFSKSAKIAAAGVGAAFAGMAVKSVELGTEFEQSFTKASTLFGDVEVDAENLKNKILDLSSSSGVAANELNEGLYSALSAGIPITEDGAEAMEFLEKSAKLAKAGFTDVDTAISATAKTLNAYGLDVSEADRIQNLLVSTQNLGITTVGELGGVLSNVTPTAAAMGLEFEQVSAALANMTAQGTPAGAATTQLNGLLAELGKTGTKAQVALEAATEGTEHAGKSFQDMLADGVPLNEILDMLDTHAQDTGMTMLDMFGSIEAGKAALALSGKNSEKFTETLDSMKNSAGSVDKAFKTVSGTSKEKMQKVMVQLENTMISLFSAIEPIITTALPILSEALGAISPIIQMVFEAIAPLIQMALPLLSELLGAVIPPLQMIFEALMPVIDAFTQVMGVVIEIVMSILPPLIEGILGIINAALKPLLKALEKAYLGWKMIFESFKEPVKKVMDVVKRIFGNVIDFIKNVFTGNWKKAIKNIVDIFKDIWGTMKAIFFAPANFIISGINLMIKGLNKIKIPDWVLGLGGKGINIPLIPKIKLAKGGLAFGETSAIVGDNPNAHSDPEVIAPLSKLKSMLKLDKLAKSTSQNMVNNVKIMVTGNYIHEEMDIQMIGEEMTRALQNEGIL